MRLLLITVCVSAIGCQAAPVSLGEYVVLDSGTPDSGAMPVEADATVDAGHVGPELIVTTDLYDFGITLLNCRKSGSISFESVSSNFITVTSIQLEGPSNFDIVRGQLPRTITPGESLELEVGFIPTSSSSSIAANVRVSYESPDQENHVDMSLSGQGVGTITFEEDLTQKSRPEIDFLFVLDQSCSMFNDLQYLQDQLGKIDAYIQGSAVDFHIGLTNMDTSATGPQGRLLDVPPFIDENTPNYTSVFRQRLTPSSGTGQETGIEASWLALSEPAITHHNAGFLRETSALAIFYLTDERGSSPRSAMAYAEDLSALRPSGMISIRAIIGKEANSSCAEQGVKYLELVQQVGGEVASICGRDWDNALTAFPPNFGLNTEFELTHPAANTALNVTVNGMPETSWALDIGSKTLVSTSSSPPNRNAEIHVQYQIDECLTP